MIRRRPSLITPCHERTLHRSELWTMTFPAVSVTAPSDGVGASTNLPEGQRRGCQKALGFLVPPFRAWLHARLHMRQVLIYESHTLSLDSPTVSRPTLLTHTKHCFGSSGVIRSRQAAFTAPTVFRHKQYQPVTLLKNTPQS